MKFFSKITNKAFRQLPAKPPKQPEVNTGNECQRSTAKTASEKPAVSSILPYIQAFFDGSSPSIEKTADSIAQLMSKWQTEEYIELEKIIRHDHAWCLWEWDRFCATNVNHLPKPQGMQSAILGLASYNSNGRVREQAVQLLAGIEDGSEIPFLLIRLNDWVDVVREKARFIIEHRLQTAEFEQFAKHVVLVFRLLNQQRANHIPLVEAFSSKLFQPKYEATFLQLIRSDHQDIRRASFRLSMEVPGAHRQLLVIMSAQSADPVIRLWAVRAAASVLSPEKLDSFLQQTENDRFMAVRRETLRITVEHRPNVAEAALMKALLDSSIAVREEARFHLRKRGGVDFAEFYRQAIRENRQLREAVAGLGEVGQAADAILLLPVLKSEHASLRRNAIIGIGRLDAKSHANDLFVHLSDESPRVVKASAKALKTCLLSIDPERLWTLFSTDQRLYVRMEALKLLNDWSSWKRLPYMIRAAVDPEEAIAMFARRSILSLRNRVYTHPSKQEREKIQKAFVETEKKLPRTLKEDLEEWMTWMDALKS